MESIEKANNASAVVLLTFDALEKDVWKFSPHLFLHQFYTIGPLQLLLNQIPEDPLKPMGYSLWKEETDCLQWLQSKAPNSIVYVNFGSIAVLTPEQLLELVGDLPIPSFPSSGSLGLIWLLEIRPFCHQSSKLKPKTEVL
ncbi:hypothetical protein M0R45_014524 [Rubus argutus]|uniref:Uncharacterized protein n=1 Tax=Rubus argutus TaxID=59490 RepID=A0AAW1XP75_RUBAR